MEQQYYLLAYDGIRRAVKAGVPIDQFLPALVNLHDEIMSMSMEERRKLPLAELGRLWGEIVTRIY